MMSPLTIELDHVFICVDRSAPAADRLAQWGLVEGAPNVHLGQGTANRRFFFANAYLEFLWIEDTQAARSPQTAPTKLWDRWTGRTSGSCPFGLILRATGDMAADSPFPGWSYEPAWLPTGLKIWIANTSIEEPMLVYMPFAEQTDWATQVVPHPVRVKGVTADTIGCPQDCRSAGFRSLPDGVRTVVFPDYLLIVEFDGAHYGETLDLRPSVPVVLRR